MAGFKNLNTIVRELRFVFNSTTNNGAKRFVDKNYIDLKKLNPEMPVLVRSGPAAPSSVHVVYRGGESVSLSLEGYTEQQVSDIVRGIAQKGQKNLSDINFLRETLIRKEAAVEKTVANKSAPEFQYFQFAKQNRIARAGTPAY
eukprot:TRINITY_DN9010_c0_g1::TRINITY_DN9010_c0_g1_i1::g.24651::m.24651 TRINITY_DN9010_c0_g1::TRINITY_DN9010_c0_g1_i1::g.24651  ORF type:complete len:155 (-),score=28.81,sp/Q07842/NDUA2_NEUCR/31.87/2e-09,L51_S25_CI-B8/PF05047.11/0.0023,Chordopox_A20R/PF05941.8/0.015 TRINITY_DN9010_c0_g1_i1:392-823(-)